MLGSDPFWVLVYSSTYNCIIWTGNMSCKFAFKEIHTNRFHIELTLNIKTYKKEQRQKIHESKTILSSQVLVWKNDNGDIVSSQFWNPSLLDFMSQLC